MHTQNPDGPRKPKGDMVVLKFTADGVDYERTELPDGKHEIECFIVDLMWKHAGQEVLDLYRCTKPPQQNRQAGFDFTLTTESGTEYLELMEVAPLHALGCTFADSPDSLFMGELADAVWAQVANKAAAYGQATKAVLHLLLYCTDYRFFLLPPFWTLVSCISRRERHPFRSIVFCAPEGTDSAYIEVVYPVAESQLTGLDEAAERRKLRISFNQSLGQIKQEGSSWSVTFEAPLYCGRTRMERLLLAGINAARVGRNDDAMDLFSKVTMDKDTPPGLKADALFNRGVVHGKLGRIKEELEDYEAVMAQAGASPDVRAKARYNRAVVYVRLGRVYEALANYEAVVGMPDAPSDLKAQAFFNRGAVRGERGEIEEALADYGAVLKMPDAPTGQKAKAFNNQGVIHGRQGETEKALADFDAVFTLKGVPPDETARAFVNRGVAYRAMGRADDEIADYGKVIAMDDAPADVKAIAYRCRGRRVYEVRDDADGMIADSRAALRLVGDLPRCRLNLALGLLLKGETHEALGEYRAAGQAAKAQEVRAMVKDVEDAVAERGPVAGADEVLDILRSRLAELECGQAAQPPNEGG